MSFFPCDFDTSSIGRWGLIPLSLNLGGLVTVAKVMLCDFCGRTIKAAEVLLGFLGLTFAALRNHISHLAVFKLPCCEGAQTWNIYALLRKDQYRPFIFNSVFRKYLNLFSSFQIFPVMLEIMFLICTF